MNYNILSAVIILAIMSIVAFFFWSRPYRRIQAIKNSPDICTQAVLVNKRSEVHRNKYGSKYIRIFVFSLSNSTKISFKVKPEIYHMHEEGDQGTLKYKEHNGTRVFVSFQHIK